MKKRYSIFLGFTLLLVSGFFSCTKINEATELGSGLIPTVDNVNTFETYFDVETSNHLFSNTEDSVYSNSSDQQLLGVVSNDPVFGTTTASMYFELKPSFYPTGVPFRRADLVNGQLDSVVLVLSFSGAWGDTNQLQQVNVYQVDSLRFGRQYLLRERPTTYSGSVLGSRTFAPKELNDSVKARHENSVNQLRITLSPAFAQRLLSLDSATLKNDSIFKNDILRGLAVVPQNSGQGNALIGINLRDTNTKLAIYYHQKNGTNKIDTAVTYLRFSPSNSASANYIERNYNGSQIQSYVGGSTQDDRVFIQNTPGSYAIIKVPGLDTLSNRIVHRAELIMQQEADPLADVLTPPSFLYLDLKDTVANKFRSVPFDAFLSLIQSGRQEFNLTPSFVIENAVDFGMRGKKVGAQFEYRFNVSRYVQKIANKTEKYTDFRLSSPFVIKESVRTTVGNTSTGAIFVNPVYGIGRIRLAGGNATSNRMRLRIIYSKL